MPCPKFGSRADPYNKLGYCEACHRQVITNIRLRVTSIGNNIVYWIGEAEKQYKSTIFYTEDLPNRRRDPKVSNGAADGFFAKGKNFTVIPTGAPSAAIRSFICGSETICECQGLLIAVLYNALLDVLSIPIFDFVFKDLEITTSVYGPGGKILQFLDILASTTVIRRGDWVYVKNTNPQFRDLASEGKVPLAAGGWNLICTESSAPPKYSGLGMVDAASLVSEFPLDEIKDKMVAPLPSATVQKQVTKTSKSSLMEDFERGPRYSAWPLLRSDIIVQKVLRLNRQRLVTLVERELRPPQEL